MQQLTIELPQELSIMTIEAHSAALLAQLAQSEGDIAFDAAALQRVDTAGVQLLCVIVGEAQAQHRAISWQSSSEALNTTAQLLGLTQTLSI